MCVGIHSWTRHPDNQESRSRKRVVDRVPLTDKQSIMIAQEADLSNQFRTVRETRQAFFKRFEIRICLAFAELHEGERMDVREIGVYRFGKLIPGHASDGASSDERFPSPCAYCARSSRPLSVPTAGRLVIAHHAESDL
jgi:hypothetical protein